MMMYRNVSSSFSVFFFLSLSWSSCCLWGRTLALEDCIDGEELLDFTFFLDEDSRLENGWTLTCVVPPRSTASLTGGRDQQEEEEDESSHVVVVWNVPMGSLSESNKDIHSLSSNPFLQQRACIAKDVTCHFTLEDLYGDGLLQPGYYYLTYGATTIAVSEEGAEFFEQAYCFGPDCPVIPLEERGDDDEDHNDASPSGECDDLYLLFHTDDAPEQTRIEIVCDGDIVLFRDDLFTAQALLEFEYCVPKNSCCTLTVGDSGSDGIDPSQGGHIFLEWANQVVLEYDNSDAFEFQKLMRDFGSTCATGGGSSTTEEEGFLEYLDDDDELDNVVAGENVEEQAEEETRDQDTNTESIENDEAVDPALDSLSEEMTKNADSKDMPLAAKIILIVLGSLVALAGLLCAVVAFCACAAASLAPLASEQHPSTIKDDDVSVSTVSHDPSTDDEETQ